MSVCCPGNGERAQIGCVTGVLLALSPRITRRVKSSVTPALRRAHKSEEIRYFQISAIRGERCFSLWNYFKAKKLCRALHDYGNFAKPLTRTEIVPLDRRVTHTGQ